MTDPVLTLDDGWTEASFERGAYGPDDRRGFEAALERGAATLAVVPVRYRREGADESMRALTEDWEADRHDPATPGPDVDPTTAFAARATYRPLERERRAVVCIAADAGDALAVALWLAAAADDDTDLQGHVHRHAGSAPPSASAPALSDDDVLAAFHADEPERCLLTGRETRSHRIELPYRYVEVLANARRTDRGVLRFPSTVRALVGAVAHSAWEERGLGDVDFGAPLERVEAGRYRLDPAAAAAVEGADASAFALERLGE